MIGEGKIKLLWGSIVLIGAIITQYIGEYTAEVYPYIVVWAILVVVGLVLTTRIPHGHREKEALGGLVWMMLAAIGVALTYFVGEGQIEAPLITIPIAWMLIVGAGAILTSFISKERFFLVPGIVVIIIAALTYVIEAVHGHMFLVFGLAFGIPMIIVGLLER